MPGEHHPCRAGLDEFLDHDRHAFVVGLDPAVGPIRADVRLRGSDPALLDLLHHLAEVRRGEEGPELAGTAHLRRVLRSSRSSKSQQWL